MNLSKKFIASIVFTFLLTFNTICLAENASNDEDYSARIAYYTMMIEKIQMMAICISIVLSPIL